MRKPWCSREGETLCVPRRAGVKKKKWKREVELKTCAGPEVSKLQTPKKHETQKGGQAQSERRLAMKKSVRKERRSRSKRASWSRGRRGGGRGRSRAEEAARQR